MYYNTNTNTKISTVPKSYDNVSGFDKLSVLEQTHHGIYPLVIVEPPLTETQKYDGETVEVQSSQVQITKNVVELSTEEIQEKLKRVKAQKIQELKNYRDDETLPHNILMFDGSLGDIVPALPVIVRKKAFDGANNARDRMGVNGISSIKWYFDDATEDTQRTELTIMSGDVSQLLKRLVDIDLNKRHMLHMKEAEIMAFTTIAEVQNYDVTVTASDGTEWVS